MRKFHSFASLLLLALPLVGCRAAPSPEQNNPVATFAGGCFWCLEASFEALPGVLDVRSGYTGGHLPNPTDEQVSDGGTGHAEAIEVIFDGDQLSYQDLLEFFWRQVDPTDAGGQFDDRGDEYRTCIYYHNSAQETAARASRQTVGASRRFSAPIVTDIQPAEPFYLAAARHQNFCTKNPERYKASHAASGRTSYFDSVWGSER